MIYIFSAKKGSILVKIGPILVIKYFFFVIHSFFFKSNFQLDLTILEKKEFYHKKNEFIRRRIKFFFFAQTTTITYDEK